MVGQDFVSLGHKHAGAGRSIVIMGRRRVRLRRRIGGRERTPLQRGVSFRSGEKRHRLAETAVHPDGADAGWSEARSLSERG